MSRPDHRQITNTGSLPADLDSDCAQIGISSAPSPGSPGDRSKAAAETNPPFHNTEGDQTESDDIMRVLGLDLVPLAIAKVAEKRRKREELAKETAQNEADLGLLEGWLDEKFPHDWWDPHAVATKTSAAPAPSAADPIGDSARPAQERPPANNQSEAPGQLENGGQRALGRPPFVNPETFKILTKSDPVEPPTALDPQPPPIQSATQPRDRKRDGGYARLTSGDDSLLPSQIFLCRRHPAPREKWRRWEIGGPQNPLQGFEVLVAQMRQIRL